MNEVKLTPMMQRYQEVKREHPGTILLFRMGDFYELFFEDAELAAKVLGLTLTSRDKGSTNPVPMAGFPYHALDSYLRKLIQAGHRVSVCDQVEDPKLAKGLVKREVTRVVTPGTLTEEALLDPKESNYLASIVPDQDSVGLAWLELSSGRFFLASIPSEQLIDELARIRPAECLVPEGKELATSSGQNWTVRPRWCFNPEAAQNLLMTHFGVKTFEGYDIEFPTHSPPITAAGALLEYVTETHRSALTHIVSIEPYRTGEYLILDEATRRNLELTRTQRDGKREGSLLASIDETVTPMGARLLGEWLANPLTNREKIEYRHQAIEELVHHSQLASDLRETLQRAYDMQRLTGRIATGRATPRDLKSLSSTLALLPHLKARLAARRSRGLSAIEANLDLASDIRSQIEATLVDEPPLSHLEGGVIRDGYNLQLDEYRDLARGGKEWIARYQAAESQRLGIPTLKVGFNKVFGYYLEVTAAQASKIPPEYVRKQTLKNQERFITPELKEHEDRVLRAEQQGNHLEQETFVALREQIGLQAPRLQRTAAALAELDVLLGLAFLAIRRGYTRPQLVDQQILEISQGKHPVLDAILPSGSFVPNDTWLGADHGLIQILTGPNMAGKSTYIRQSALLVILAQIGSFIPARAARIGIVDRIFARVGASDELSRGLSTFMVEMTETARILNAATSRSLVILDEIGRGTSTYDGISLAWSVTEFLHDAIGCLTLFATHYHELTSLAETLPNVRNWTVAVREQDDEIYFLHRIVAGPADRSYGIHVAKLAGVPQDVIDRAKVVLEGLERQGIAKRERLKPPVRGKLVRRRERQLNLFTRNDPAMEHADQQDSAPPA